MRPLTLFALTALAIVKIVLLLVLWGWETDWRFAINALESLVGANRAPWLVIWLGWKMHLPPNWAIKSDAILYPLPGLSPASWI